MRFGFQSFDLQIIGLLRFFSDGVKQKFENDYFGSTDAASIMKCCGCHHLCSFVSNITYII